MNKKRFVKKLGLPANHRKALIRSQVKDLISFGYLRTTKSRAFEVSRMVDILGDFVTKGNKKRIYDYLRDYSLLDKFSKYVLDSGRRTGFVSEVKMGNRKGDNAEIVLLELIKS